MLKERSKKKQVWRLYKRIDWSFSVFTNPISAIDNSDWRRTPLHCELAIRDKHGNSHAVSPYFTHTWRIFSGVFIALKSPFELILKLFESVNCNEKVLLCVLRGFTLIKPFSLYRVCLSQIFRTRFLPECTLFWIIELAYWRKNNNKEDIDLHF